MSSFDFLIRYWSSDVCSSVLDLLYEVRDHLFGDVDVGDHAVTQRADRLDAVGGLAHHQLRIVADRLDPLDPVQRLDRDDRRFVEHDALAAHIDHRVCGAEVRSEEHTSELQSLMRTSYAVFCLQNKNYTIQDR